MRHLRHKAIRKALKQYHFLCGIKAPYKVLIDGNFIAMCVQMKVDLRERVPKFLQVKPNECEFYISHASLEELNVLGEEQQDYMKEALEIARTFHLADSNTKENKTLDDVSKAICQLIGEKNPRKFLVATQEVELRKILRNIPGVPLMYLNRSVLVFEEISKATLAIVRADEKQKREKLDQNEKRKLEVIQKSKEKKQEKEEQQKMIQKRNKRKAKAPNPLSCKKKTTKKKRRTNNKNKQIEEHYFKK
jgi:U3 small nucleolar RNA-associated protein 23